ncbi:uncharacterized protein BO96DRAFT_328460 [Aspergillus niger CBS 101883]|uniref:Uncharacterized protein n=2 Tax=Aspergillus niger TaxID=5061 RepID=A2QF92_ASPNC|nr:uncharacterized protein BO96DRAFT_328460 [Aspergillus niger CBS 101883]XP_059600136.1 hypothetical protein An02g13720 [Aspergillus niger]PYH60488.1 hypothetical protein BO96DRAFT_328460 [Aspergillus niger CBS 101883]CAK37956.1 hypothetical protein An02g13720 [Aspergillus niger]
MVRSAPRPARYGRSLAVLGAMFHHRCCRVGLGRTHLSGYKPPQCGYTVRQVPERGMLFVPVMFGSPCGEEKDDVHGLRKSDLLGEAVSWSDWGYLDSILRIFRCGCSLVVCFVPDPWNRSRIAKLALGRQNGEMEKIE